MVHEGKSVTEVARNLGIGHSLLQYWKNQVEEKLGSCAQSVLSVWKKLSATALSRQFPGRLMLHVMPSSVTDRGVRKRAVRGFTPCPLYWGKISPLQAPVGRRGYPVREAGCKYTVDAMTAIATTTPTARAA